MCFGGRGVLTGRQVCKVPLKKHLLLILTHYTSPTSTSPTFLRRGSVPSLLHLLANVALHFLAPLPGLCYELVPRLVELHPRCHHLLLCGGWRRVRPVPRPMLPRVPVIPVDLLSLAAPLAAAAAVGGSRGRGCGHLPLLVLVDVFNPVLVQGLLSLHGVRAGDRNQPTLA